MAQGKLDTSVLSRLNKVERELKQAKECIRKRDQEIKDLKMKLAKSKGGDKDHMTQHVSEMRAELAEMKAFLNDYGMVWIGGRVGQQSGGSSKAAGETRDDSRGQGGKEVTLAKENVRLIQTRVKELNEMVGDDTKAGGERGMETLTLFKDGITFHDKPFRPFSDKSAQLVIRDLVDGYFPQELKSEYPEGVKIRLVSKIDQTYDATVKKAASKPKPMSNIRQLSSLNEDEEPEASTQSVLEKIPKTVIHNGKIVQMREDIGSLVHLEEKVPEKMPIRSLFTQKLNMADFEKLEGEDEDGCQDEDKDSGAEEGPVAKTVIQVKREDGMQTYVLKFPHWATIQDVRNALDTHRRKDEGTSSGDYVLRSAFPPQVYKNVHQTLESAGLVPNATLFMKTT